MAKTLNIIESAYRATLEEQDDTIVWITSAMKKGGADVDVLLAGNAVNYAVKKQDAAGLQIGAWKQAHPPNLQRDLDQLREAGARVFAVKDDIAELGLESSDLIGAVKPVPRSQLAALFADYARVWRW